MIKPITFLDYDKITDLVYDLGQHLVLEMVVSLSRKNEKTLDRYHYHKEFKYDTKYANTNMYSIKRSFDYFLVLNKVDVSGSGVMIRVQDMYLILSKLKAALKWFETSGVYGVKSGTKELYIKTKQQSILIPNLAAGKYIQLDPIVIVFENTGYQTQGVRITLSDPSIFADIVIDRFYGLVYILNNLDMYGCAQNMVNYLQRPEFGTNLKEFENNSYLDIPEEKEVMTSGMDKNRQIGLNQKPKTFFDKIDGLTT